MAGFHKAGPNEALIVSGGGKQPTVKVGGRKFVLPIVQKAQYLLLEVMTLTVNTAKVYTSEGVAVTVDGVAQVKVGRGEEAIRTAAQQFLDKRPDEIANIALQTLEGQQRAILGTMTVEQIYQDRVAFAERVREVAASDMTNMGLEIVSFSIRDIQDEQGYLEALGVRRTSEVKRDAAIGEAEAKRDAGIKEAQADQQGQAARFQADTEIAESEQDFATEKAQYDRQVNARKAGAELAYQFQEAKTRKQIREEELQIDVVERQKQIQVQEQEIIRRERELDATVRRPAEAERDRLETVADGERRRIRVEAEAERFRLETVAEGEKARILAEAEAEAEAMNRKADAWKQYGQAAMIQQLFETLPEVANAVAQPLAKTDRITVISTGGSDSEGAGAAKVTRDVTNTVAQIPALIESLTGVDLLGTLKNLPGIVTTEGTDSQQPTSGDGASPEEPAPESEE